MTLACDWLIARPWVFGKGNAGAVSPFACLFFSGPAEPVEQRGGEIHPIARAPFNSGVEEKTRGVPPQILLEPGTRAGADGAGDGWRHVAGVGTGPGGFRGRAGLPSCLTCERWLLTRGVTLNSFPRAVLLGFFYSSYTNTGRIFH